MSGDTVGAFLRHCVNMRALSASLAQALIDTVANVCQQYLQCFQCLETTSWEIYPLPSFICPPLSPCLPLPFPVLPYLPLEVGPLNPARSGERLMGSVAEPQPKFNVNMTSGGNNFNYFPDSQRTTFGAV